MSKSLGAASYIAIRDDSETIKQKIKKAVTDEQGVKNLLELYSYFGDKNKYQKMLSQYKEAKLMNVELKEELSQTIIKFLAPIQERIKELEKNPAKVKELATYDALIVPGGFGKRGIEGKIAAVRFARENKIPYLGICLGLQIAMVEFARNKAGMADANSTEFDLDTPYPVVGLVTEWIDHTGQVEKRHKDSNKGGTMRLGGQTCKLMEGTLARKMYGQDTIIERHRHRYEVNNAYIEPLEKAGFVFSGSSPDGRLMEIAELSKNEHPFYLGTQFHPEFKSRPLTPHPLFYAFVKACISKKK